MPAPRPIPVALLHVGFTRATARAAGVSDRMLEGSRFVQEFPRVWRVHDTPLSHHARIAAAGLSMPDHAHLTGITRIQALGLDFGPREPLWFVVAADLHRQVDGIFLHRTEVLPPLDDTGVTPAAAFIAYCAMARTLDAIKVGDWLLHGGHMSLISLRELARRDTWRAGAREAAWVSRHLDARSRSLPESETRAVLSFAGLPEAEVNVPIREAGEIVAITDLLIRPWNVAVEYEGTHHQTDRAQWITDVDRYGMLRRMAIPYVQVTKEKARTPRRVVGEVHRALVAAGFDGRPPQFGSRWSSLFAPLSEVVRMRRPRPRR